MPVPARTPVIVGRAQIVDTEPDLDNPTDPIQLMTRAAAAAVTDAGIDASSIDLVGVVAGLFRHPNPGRAIGDAIGSPHLGDLGAHHLGRQYADRLRRRTRRPAGSGRGRHDRDGRR